MGAPQGTGCAQDKDECWRQEGEVSHGGVMWMKSRHMRKTQNTLGSERDFWVFAVMFLLCNFRVLETNTNNENLRI